MSRVQSQTCVSKYLSNSTIFDDPQFKTPGPGYYQQAASKVKARNATIFSSVPRDLEDRLKDRTPGPGHYNSYNDTSLSKKGIAKLATEPSELGNRLVSPGPGSYNFFLLHLKEAELPSFQQPANQKRS